MANYILAIDQGTTNSRAILFNFLGEASFQHSIPIQQSFPREGWVEQNPLEMVDNVIECCREVLKKANCSPKNIAAIGICNQRETTILWNKLTGQPIYPAIVWQDRRTSDYCKQLSKTKLNYAVHYKTGLLLDPYFSATKIRWILDNVPDAREQAERGEILFGTVDTYLLWNLTQQKLHVTDITNASRTLLYNIHTQTWDNELIDAFQIPKNLLPSVLDNIAHFGDLDKEVLGESIPIRGVAGDQQAAGIGQACFQKGMVKATYGTGCFMLLNTGEKVLQTHHQLLSTILYRINHQTHYGLEGSIFSAGTTIKWLRDHLKIIERAEETEKLAASINSTEGVYFIPAFTGLGAPYWDPHARAAIMGLNRNSGRAQIVRAALESVAYQSLDLLKTMTSDHSLIIQSLRVDGGMTANQWLLQFLSDILRIPVQTHSGVETSALGVSYLAGLAVGIYQSLDEISQFSEKFYHKNFLPLMSEKTSTTLYQQWEKMIKKVLSS